jgi:hypothetical protein
MKFPLVSPVFLSNPFASNLKLAPWNRELGSIGRVVDEENTPVGEGDQTSCIPQGERSSSDLPERSLLVKAGALLQPSTSWLLFSDSKFYLRLRNDLKTIT